MIVSCGTSKYVNVRGVKKKLALSAVAKFQKNPVLSENTSKINMTR